MSIQTPRLIITPGEPSGIGPEICLKIAHLKWAAELIFIVDPAVLQQYASLLKIDVDIQIWQPCSERQRHVSGQMNVLPVNISHPVEPGILSSENAEYVIQTLSIAAELMLSKQADAIVTGPVHKGILNSNSSLDGKQIQFSGHTEFFAEKSNTTQVVMMLTTEQFRVALVTTHLPLKEVSDAITVEKISKVIEILRSELETNFSIENPCIHVCGLNPHAGESGYLGMEEINVIEPALRTLRAKGYDLVGPLPADTALTPAGLVGADATLAMYHDQGLPVLKYAGFGDAVNITLGLPFVRVSVDHGTALDISGKGRADVGSLIAAIKQAIVMTS